MKTTFSIVIATRNRAAALALSLPLHLAQSRRPERILVVDSSDDKSANIALVKRLAATTDVDLEHQASEPGTSKQRNIGLAQVTSDVTFFPDDDSLLYPEALARMMHIYDLDRHGRIGGVCAVEAATPPPGVLVGQTTAYQMRKSDRIRARIAPWRTKFEDKFFPDPMKLVAKRLQQHLPAPEAWLENEHAVWVEWMTGFRMSFRTEVVKQVGFNEQLGRYALYEDIDAGLGVQASGYSLVATRDARIYHHKAPETRTNGRQMGVINILNRAYVVMRSGQLDARIKASLTRHAGFRIAQFRAGARSEYGKDRLMGAQAAYKLLPELLTAQPHQLDDTYRRLRDLCLTGELSNAR
jgi:glycosyltransferase involved in cell wall biosynthesis